LNELLSSDSFSSAPTVFWKREGKSKPMNADSKDTYSFIGPILQIPFITRHQGGAYLCIASVSATLHRSMFAQSHFPTLEWNSTVSQQATFDHCQL